VKAGLHDQDGAAPARPAGKAEGRDPGGVGGRVVAIEGAQAGGADVVAPFCRDAIEKPGRAAALHDDGMGNIVPR
jgi:hypothetical protein